MLLNRLTVFLVRNFKWRSDEYNNEWNLYNNIYVHTDCYCSTRLNLYLRNKNITWNFCVILLSLTVSG